MNNNRLVYLLAFADDGVIWGRMDDNKLVIAYEASQEEDKKYHPKLRGETLQQAHLFSEKMEIRLFRDELGEWKFKEIRDEGNVIIESQILWGDKKDEKEEHQPGNLKFTKLLADRKGIPPQILPIERKEYADGKFVRLEVHHLVDFDEKTGEAYIKLSRLAGLIVEKKKMEVAK
jgi:CRISPR-associated protein (TIGR03984 family)